MTQLRFLGLCSAMVAVLAVAMPRAATAGQEPARVVNRGDLTFTSATVGTESVLAVETPAVRVEHRAGQNGTGRILVVADAERIEVHMSPTALRVSRGGITHTLDAQSLTASHIGGVRSLLQRAGLARTLATLRAAMPADAPVPLTTAVAFVRMLAGEGAAMRRIADEAGAARGGIQFARQAAAACWSSYQNSMWIFFLDLESCIYDNQWNMAIQYGCSFAYLVQSEIAWFSLIACAGGLPGV